MMYELSIYGLLYFSGSPALVGDNTQQGLRAGRPTRANALSVDLFTDVVFEQKLEYIHNSPIQERWKLALYAEDYRWSSAGFYAGRKNEFEWLTPCDDV